MREIKHTPGPWVFVDREVMEDGSVYPKHIVGGKHQFQVCLLESREVAQLAYDKPDAWPEANEATNANARLIAAAPELLDTLEAIKQAIRDYYSALATRQHGGVAQDNAFRRIESILGMGRYNEASAPDQSTDKGHG